MVQKLKKEIKYSERVIAANNDEIVKKDTEITSLKQALAVANNETTNRKNVLATMTSRAESLAAQIEQLNVSQ